MMEIELYKFITENKIKYEWDNKDVLCWIPFDLISVFVLLFSIETEDVVMVNLQQDCICVEMRDICDIIGIDIEKVFNK